ncbi:PFL_4703 family integrating conjugative element protein [Photorhabdus heterorhabditis]|uniref:PFL_4703 family integrating conjugative element protein n=1 Tax=Photorhabdus heterorhabditis TaxID=880156 RepID=UPI001BD5B711|nr:TIGR03746 family integrating conjugative element protein [Photorhabdus heterorhabditis]MBS9441295.1 TIGR03746 family integrating conjugative element protein [Photorhabdus heterorhabditis]
MSRFRHAIQDRDQHILTLRAACGVLVLLLLLSLSGWMMAPRALTIYTPPDVRSGSTRPWWQVPVSQVYAFGFYIFQQLNAWPKDGEVDYPAKIAALSPYLTPSCQVFLEQDAQNRSQVGELKDRVRVVYEIPERGFRDSNVMVKDRDNWVIRLDLVADEYFHAEPVKRALVRYPLKVTRWQGDAERNPFGLALDCYDSTPQRLEAASQPAPAKKGIFQ